MIFFFKQRTAYVMRISDWSSDVCSSDLDRIDERICDLFSIFGPEGFPRLLRGGAQVGFEHEQRADVHLRHRDRNRSRVDLEPANGEALAAVERPARNFIGQREAPPDRKSVGEGKSVSVRLSSGGRL